MYHLKSKQRFRKLSILILVPYIVLCITAGWFHAFDESAYHGHNANNYHSDNTGTNPNKAANSMPILCYNDHNEDNCIICKWLKSTPKKIQLSLEVSHSIQDASGLYVNEQQAYFFLNNRNFHSRSPPLTIS